MRRIPNDLQEHGSCEEGTLLSTKPVATTVVASDISMTAAGSTCRGAALLRAQVTLIIFSLQDPPALQLDHRQVLGSSRPSGASSNTHPRHTGYRKTSIARVVRVLPQVRKLAIVYINLLAAC